VVRVRIAVQVAAVADTPTARTELHYVTTSNSCTSNMKQGQHWVMDGLGSTLYRDYRFIFSPGQPDGFWGPLSPFWAWNGGSSCQE